MFFRLVCLLLVIESKDAATNDNDSGWLDSNYFTGFVPEEALYNLEELTDLNLQSNPVLCGALDVSRLPENATLDLSDTLINQECPGKPHTPVPSQLPARQARRPPGAPAQLLLPYN
eukprot:gene12376-14619_t